MSTREKMVINGLVLRETQTKESDKILTVLTAELGKIGVVARGVRKQKSQMSASAQMLTYSEMTLNQHGDWYYLAEASTIECFTGLHEDMEKLALGSYFAELVESVTASAQEDQSILSLLLNALYALSNLDYSLDHVKSAFEWRLMEECGFAPYVEACTICGNEDPERPYLNLAEGVLYCDECSMREGQGIAMPLCPNSLEALRYVLSCPGKKLYQFSLGEKPMQRFHHASEAFCASQLERSFPTLDFYKKLARTTKGLLQKNYESNV